MMAHTTKRLLCLLCGLLCWISVEAQTYTISGYLRDSTNGESMIGATIALKGTAQGVQSNHYGFYALNIPAGDYVLVFSFLGYQTREQALHVQGSQQLNIDLAPASYQAQEVVISGKRKDGNVRNTDMGRIELSTAQALKLPALMGEVDILKSLQLMPGLQSAGEGNAGFYVRGGGPDQNLILLDEAPVYNSGHLLGFFSVFNSDAIKSTTLIKGGMPANYGGRLSSVVDITMKDGNNKKLQGEGGIGLISSRLSLQGPLVKNKASFIVSGRRTYIDLITKPFLSKSSSFYGSGYYFYDLNIKANYLFSDKDRLYLSAYVGRDVFAFVNSQRHFNVHIPWGNTTATIRWNHVFNKRLFSNSALLYNDYKFSFAAGENTYHLRLNSEIRDFNGKTDFDYFASFKHHIKFGGNYIYHTFIPSSVSGGQDTTKFTPDNPFKKNAHEGALYVMDDWDISPSFKLNAGLRYSIFDQIGPYKYYTEDANGVKTDSVSFGKGKPVKTYSGLEPRITLRYAWDDRNALKASYTRNNQYVHLVTNAGTTLPTDIWVPSTYHVKPQQADQYALGYFRNFEDNAWETSVEAYYKEMHHQVEYREGYTPALDDPEQDFVFGKGWSYGSEFFIHKIKGRLTGWVGYTLAWTWRQFPDLNEGRKYPAKYDRRHDLSVVGMYELNDRWSLSGVFIYATGNMTSLPERFYFIENTLVQQTGAINTYRMPAYHRLDLSAIYKPKPKHPNRRVQGSWAFSIYNVYSRQNPYFLYFDQTGSALGGDLKVQAKQVSIFPIIPSATWNFKF